jgi:hypothetical protein
MIDHKSAIAREAATTARTLVRARANGEIEFFALVLRDAVARGSATAEATGAAEEVEQNDWQYALIASLATLGAVALGRSTGVGNVEREEARRRTDAWIETMAKKDLTF